MIIDKVKEYWKPEEEEQLEALKAKLESYPYMPEEAEEQYPNLTLEDVIGLWEATDLEIKRLKKKVEDRYIEDRKAKGLLEDVAEIVNAITKEDFIARMNEFKNRDNLGADFIVDDTPYAEMVAGELKDEEVETISERPEYAVDTIDKLEKNSRDVTVSGRVVSISNPRSFKTRKGASGEVCNVELQDNTGKIRAVFWTQNIKLLKNVKEGDIIQIKNVDIKEGYTGLEANLRPRSPVIHLDEDPSKFPAYEEEITDIADIKPETKVNIIARIVRIPTIRSYEKNGKEGKVASLELVDKSGKITYTLWNKNVELIKELGLEDGDTVKILQAQARERENRDGEKEISLTHWDGRIIKGDYELPEIVQEFTPIGDVSEQKDVNIKGIVSRLQDIKTFLRKTDNTEGRLRNFDVRDLTGEIRVTVWGDDTKLPINKGDIIKIIGGEVRYDEYTQSQYSMNTNFNTQISINPKNLSEEELDELESLKADLHPTPIGKVQRRGWGRCPCCRCKSDGCAFLDSLCRHCDGCGRCSNHHCNIEQYAEICRRRLGF